MKWGRAMERRGGDRDGKERQRESGEERWRAMERVSEGGGRRRDLLILVSTAPGFIRLYYKGKCWAGFSGFFLSFSVFL